MKLYIHHELFRNPIKIGEILKPIVSGHQYEQAEDGRPVFSFHITRKQAQMIDFWAWAFSQKNEAILFSLKDDAGNIEMIYANSIKVLKHRGNYFLDMSVLSHSYLSANGSGTNFGDPKCQNATTGRIKIAKSHF